MRNVLRHWLVKDLFIVLCGASLMAGTLCAVWLTKPAWDWLLAGYIQAVSLYYEPKLIKRVEHSQTHLFIELITQFCILFIGTFIGVAELLREEWVQAYISLTLPFLAIYRLLKIAVIDLGGPEDDEPTDGGAAA